MFNSFIWQVEKGSEQDFVSFNFIIDPVIWSILLSFHFLSDIRLANVNWNKLKIVVLMILPDPTVLGVDLIMHYKVFVVSILGQLDLKLWVIHIIHNCRFLPYYNVFRTAQLWYLDHVVESKVEIFQHFIYNKLVFAPHIFSAAVACLDFNREGNSLPGILIQILDLVKLIDCVCLWAEPRINFQVLLLLKLEEV